VAICLDWGFAETLRCEQRTRRVKEPFWQLRRSVRARRAPWTHDGTPAHVYLIQPGRLAVFPYGAAFLDAIALLAPGSAEVERHADREGDLAFLAVRFPVPHRIAYRDGFEIVLR
jgi:hypothetical protein